MAVSNEVFLFSCIDNSNNGTVNWQKVADECGIVSKAAAAIKFKRMKDKFGTISTNGTNSPAGSKTPSGADDGDDAEKTKKTPKKTPAKKTPKKRKMDAAAEEDIETTTVKAEDGDLI